METLNNDFSNDKMLRVSVNIFFLKKYLDVKNAMDVSIFLISSEFFLGEILYFQKKIVVSSKITLRDRSFTMSGGGWSIFPEIGIFCRHALSSAFGAGNFCVTTPNFIL